MRHTVLLFAALSFLPLSLAQAAPAVRKAPAAKVAPKPLPPFEFRGHRPGEPKPSVIEKVDRIGDIHIWSGINYTYDETGLVEIIGFLGVGYVAQLRDAFILKYGKPQSTSQLKLINGRGVPFTSQTDIWRFREGTLTLTSDLGVNNDGMFEFETYAWAAKEGAKDKERANAAARDL